MLALLIIICRPLVAYCAIAGCIEDAPSRKAVEIILSVKSLFDAEIFYD